MRSSCCYRSSACKCKCAHFNREVDICRPQSEERAEVLTIKEDVFRKVDDSVLSIIPSRLSSRLSITGSDWGSIRSNATGNLRYIPFSFDNDLFTSYVYKRNYRPLSNLRKSITDDYGNQLRDQSMDEYGAMKESASIFEMKRRDYIRTVRAQYDRVKDAWSGFRATAVLVSRQITASDIVTDRPFASRSHSYHSNQALISLTKAISIALTTESYGRHSIIITRWREAPTETLYLGYRKAETLSLFSIHALSTRPG